MAEQQNTTGKRSGSAINRLLAKSPPGVPMTSAWLASEGVTPQMLWGYKNSQWLEPLARGVWIRPGHNVTWAAAIYALQREPGMQIWPAGATALGLLGQAHFVPQGQQPRLQLGLGQNSKLPAWFKRMPFARQLTTFNCAQLFDPADFGLVGWSSQDYSLKISAPERAVIEACSLLPRRMDPEEVFQLAQGLPALRPALLQSLLAACRSVKAKRLFMVLAELLDFPWLAELQREQIELGAGKRSLEMPGSLHAKYQITVPAAWEPQESHDGF